MNAPLRGLLRVAEYRLYCLDDEGRFAKSHEIYAENDADAFDKARAMKLDVVCELWNRDRFVGKLPRNK